MRTGTETLLRQWFRTKKDRELFLEGVEGGETRRKKLFEQVEKCFLDQGLTVPEAYRYKTAEEAEVRDRFGFMDFGEKEEDPKVEVKKDVDEQQVDEKAAPNPALDGKSGVKPADEGDKPAKLLAGEPTRPPEEGQTKDM